MNKSYIQILDFIVLGVLYHIALLFIEPWYLALLFIFFSFILWISLSSLFIKEKKRTYSCCECSTRLAETSHPLLHPLYEDENICIYCSAHIDWDDRLSSGIYKSEDYLS